ncbi:MAG: hypothetical protein QOD25_860 [Alphaproteobacteria bacterium]|nr:hypothetical protein [Alphaproteobacteria bacterium]
MTYRTLLEGIFSSDVLLGDQESCSTRRGLLLAPLLAALPLALSGTAAQAGRINSSETQVILPDAIKWSGWINGFPPHSGEMAAWTSLGLISY